MSAALPGIIFIVAVLGIGWLRRRRLARDLRAARSARRDLRVDLRTLQLAHAALIAVHAETVTDRDKAILLLLQHIARLERETGAAVEVLMARIAALTAQLAEHLAGSIDEDTIAVELRELLEQEATS